MIAAGEGITLMPQLALREELLTGVEAHELPGLGFRRISLCYRESRRPSPALRAAIDFVREFVALGDEAAESNGTSSGS